LGGFSQGACLALDAAARRGGRLGGVIAYAGGLIGPEIDRARYAPDLAGTPIFLGSSDPDPHIPTDRVEESAATLRELGAVVDLRLYPDLGHTVNEDQLDAGRALLARVLRDADT
ncbi:MAG: dienelactone hydrolase family protein, partial [Trueperaceae bacterium]